MESKNLIVRETVFDDCKYFAEWETWPQVTEFFTMDEERSYEQVVTEFVRNNPRPVQAAVYYYPQATGQAYWQDFLSRINRTDDSLDITRIYIADVNQRGKGYGEEALRLVLEFAFINLHMERVTIDHFEKNKPAAALYEKIGFQTEGLMRNAGKKNGKYINLQLKSMLRAEYYDKIHTK